jgi:hypothetical protein
MAFQQRIQVRHGARNPKSSGKNLSKKFRHYVVNTFFHQLFSPTAWRTRFFQKVMGIFLQRFPSLAPPLIQVMKILLWAAKSISSVFYFISFRYQPLRENNFSSNICTNI